MAADGSNTAMMNSMIGIKAVKPEDDGIDVCMI